MKEDLRIFKDSKALSVAATEICIQSAAQAVKERNRFLVALSGGSTPSGLYRILASEPHRSRIDWKKTFVFWGDERCVRPEEEGSNYHQAYEMLLSQVPIPEGNIERIKGELEPAEASQDYARILKAYAAPGMDWPRFDLVWLGMGEDGHTASLFPGSPVEASSPTLAVTAHYQGRPAKRVTLTPLALNSARLIVFLATGAAKAATLKTVLGNAFQPELFPAQRIRPQEGKVIWLVDEAAGSQISQEN